MRPFRKIAAVGSTMERTQKQAATCSIIDD
jgi:hypothetical protein